MRRLPIALLILGAPVMAQTTTHLVVPSRYATVDAPGTAFWISSPFAARRQLLIDESHLPGLRGKQLTGICLRRNGGDGASFPAGKVGLKMTLSHAPVVADRLSNEFAKNRGATGVVVFDRQLTLPASPATTKTPPWKVKVTFQKPFRYAGGTLCIETVTTPVSQPGLDPAWWPIDAVASPASGRVTSIGKSCIPGMGATPAGAEATGFTPGATATLFLQGRTQATQAICFLGSTASRWGSLPLPLDLKFVGAPGCHVWTALSVPVPLALRRLPRSGVSLATLSMRVPSSSAVVGANLYSQWVVADRSNAFGLATSNGVRGVVGTTAAQTGINWLEATDLKSVSGAVLRGRVPVLRFVAQ